MTLLEHINLNYDSISHYARVSGHYLNTVRRWIADGAKIKGDEIEVSKPRIVGKVIKDDQN